MVTSLQFSKDFYQLSAPLNLNEAATIRTEVRSLI